jgi:hypothetical protein
MHIRGEQGKLLSNILKLYEIKSESWIPVLYQVGIESSCKLEGHTKKIGQHDIQPSAQDSIGVMT